MSAVATRQAGMLAFPFADCREPVTEGHTVLSMFSEEAFLPPHLTGVYGGSGVCIEEMKKFGKIF